MTYGHEPDWTDKIGMAGVTLAIILLFITLTQPAWRGNEMLAEMRANCKKVSGVMLETKGMFGNTYECSPHYDQGVKP